jgi:hypothetical protein
MPEIVITSIRMVINPTRRKTVPHPHSLPTIPETGGRHDMYRFIHKALRKAQCDMLVRIGQIGSTTDLPALLVDLRQLLAFGSGHIAHEETFVHPALEARTKGATAELVEQHDSHREAFRRLEETIVRLEAAVTPEQRNERVRQLYLSYSVFVAHDFEHMIEEETDHNAQLWAVFTDGELLAIEGAIVGSMPPEKAIYSMRLMLPALSRDERLLLLSGVKAKAPPPVFEAVINLAARMTLSAADFAELEHELGLEMA